MSRQSERDFADIGAALYGDYIQRFRSRLRY